jgi:topoisomerase IA-like protein
MCLLSLCVCTLIVLGCALQPIRVMQGRFGPYIKYNKANIKLPVQYRDEPATLPYDAAVQAIQDSGKFNKGKKGSKGDSPTSTT